MTTTDIRRRLYALQLMSCLNEFPVMVKVDEPFVQKYRRASAKKAEAITAQLSEAAAMFRWKYRPRAGVSVALRFGGWQLNDPNPHKLAKYYLDLMQGILFADDRQVEYLTASVVAGDGPRWAGIRVARMANRRKRLKLLRSALTNPHLASEILAEEPWDDFSDDDPFSHSPYWVDFWTAEWRDDQLANALDFLEDLEEPLNELERVLLDSYRSVLQDRGEVARLGIQAAGLLTLAQIHGLTDPGTQVGGDWRFLRMKEVDTVVALNSAVGGGLRSQVLRGVEDLAAKFPWLDRMGLPVDLDVLVQSPSRVLRRDLDNLMRDIAPGVFDALGADGNFFRGFRIQDRPHETSGIWIRLVPAGMVIAEQQIIDDTLERVKDIVESDLY